RLERALVVLDDPRQQARLLGAQGIAVVGSRHAGLRAPFRSARLLPVAANASAGLCDRPQGPVAGGGASGTTGRTTLTRAPCGATFSAWASPPCACARSRTIASPRPEPGPDRDGSARKNRSKTRSVVPGGNPGPSSVTRNAIVARPAGSPAARASSHTCPPG